jgi:hypothetical protein
MNQVKVFQNMRNSWSVVVSDAQTGLMLKCKTFQTKNEAIAFAVDYGFCESVGV